MSTSSLAQVPIRDADAVDSLWDLLASPTIDPASLARAIERALVRPELDWRTLQLLKEGWQALEHFADRSSLQLDEYLLNQKSVDIKMAIQARTAAVAESHRDVKFPSLEERLMPHLSPSILRQFLREVGIAIARPAAITIGGAASLILRGLLSRATEDVDVVDEVPVEIREQRQLLHALSARYGLHITHFQGHYLPRGWGSRTTDFGMFGKIHVNLVDPLDIIAGKVSSSRPKDLDDFRLLSLSLDKEQLRQRVTQEMAPHGSREKDRQQAIQNWYIVYGEDLEFRS
jgi:hypothetical protein